MCLAFVLMMVLQACANKDKDRVGLPAASPSPQSDDLSSYNIVKYSSAIIVKLGGEPYAEQPLKRCPFCKVHAPL